MSDLILYHGSSDIIEKPEYGKGKVTNDYGLGFYCTEHEDLAKEWACTDERNGYANKYSLDTTGLRFLNLSGENFTILNWIALLLDNRKITVPSPIGKRGMEYLHEHFLPDISGYDVIIGYRADDSYFSFARAFLSNTISVEQLARAMKLGKLGEQVVLKTPKAFDALRFSGYSIADRSVYYAKRKSRDDRARAAYQKELESEELNGLFLRDIIREEVRQNDPRLR